ncbi:acyl-CoA dehydrogenase family protein [Rhodococcus rhodochrous]|uniref:Dibenzothiophene monooxygenase n=1 Tax=Rhodococcus rhodochrous TaxID=1829 RepID=A0AA46WYA8_RHORH|nr:acyl-CoA dehydrogenase family protein [Rhodococcus rhodochrous]UZF46684.1 acyl-CoA dehydrogenase family protein [Rhodococcus rhodochrous]
MTAAQADSLVAASATVTGATGEEASVRFLEELRARVATFRDEAPSRDRERRYPFDEVEQLRNIKFWALNVPVEFGGLGLDRRTLIQAIIAVSSVDGSLGQLPQNHFATVERLLLSGSPEQREFYLRELGSGAIFGNATAEPGERRPGEAHTTVVERDGRLYLSGRKVYATGSLFGDFIAVQARNEAGGQETVVVRPDDQGVVIHDDWDSFGQRTTGSGSAEFDDVEVQPIQLLSRSSDPATTYRISALSQLIHAAIDTGLAEGALYEALALARRVHGGRGSGAAEFRDDVLGVAHLGELRIATTAARRLVESAARRLDSLGPDTALSAVIDVFYEVVQAKVLSTRTALSVTTDLFDVGGSSSTKPAFGLDRYWRDARTHTLHDAVRWKPYSLGKWLIDEEVADAWSLARPLLPLVDLENAADDPVAFYGSAR